jgi:protein required for attachment to host cells
MDQLTIDQRGRPMNRACIAIIDATRARIYMYHQTPEDDGARSSPIGALHEVLDLVNPGRRGHDLFSTTKPGIKRAAPGSGSTDDHREAHFAELDRRFTRHVTEQIDRLARIQGYHHVLVVASPGMLGELRADDALDRPDLTVEYIARDIAQLTSPQIHDHLARLRLVAPRRLAAS